MQMLVLGSALMFWLALSPLLIEAAQNIPIEVLERWSSGFKGKIRVKDLVEGGWQMKMNFSTPVKNLQIWRAKLICTLDEKTFYLKNMNWNRNLYPNSEMFFIANIPKSRPFTGNAIITPQNQADKVPCTSPTPAPTTRAPTTQKPTTIKPTTLAETTVKPSTAAPTTAEPTIPVTCPSAPTVTTGPSWREAFKVQIHVPLCKAKVTGGWQLKLEFSSEVSRVEIWRADEICKVNGKIFYFKNKDWNADLQNGGSYLIDLNAHRTGDDPTVAVTFTPNSDGPADAPCSGPQTNPPPPVTTQTPDTQPPSTIEPDTQPPSTSAPDTQAPSTSAPDTQAPSTSAPDTQPPLTDVPVTSNAPETESPTTKAPDTQGPTSKPPKYDYDEVLHKSILFYEAQRSGKLPSNNRVPWRKDSALNDQGENGEDLTGGWYDAGDYVKFGLPMASSTTVLSWGLIEFRDSYKQAKELANMESCIRWPLDYFLKAIGDNEFYAQVGDGYVDHAYWGRPEDMKMNRPAFKVTSQKPGSDVAGETAAALAAGSLAFRNSDPNYSDNLLQNAKKLYTFAKTYKGKYSDSIPGAAEFYASSGYKDELAWAAAWLSAASKTTSERQKYLKDAKNFNSDGIPWSFDWDNKAAGVELLLFKLTGEDKYKTKVKQFLNSWRKESGFQYTPKGLAFRLKWGSNRYAANVAFLATVAAQLGLDPQSNMDWARGQIHYMLGDAGRSFVVGFGTNPPKQPHHASSTCAAKPAPCGWNQYHEDKSNAFVLKGALVGGPGSDDSYEDRRDDYQHNEVTTDYNAGFQSAVAGLKHAHISGDF